MSSIFPIISTPDLPRLQDFYQRVLGATEVSRTPDEGPAFYVGLRVGDAELGLVAEAGTEVGTTPRILLTAEVDDVDALLGRVETAGGTVLGPPNDMPWGQRVAHTLDPDGNALNLTRTIPPPT
ncbi:VOC family protein [Plantactinospora sp. S1510]|uniref:VOC family protein n=1 Tax=Plantactinospora alkalitolerans TaxID=2789879 RepID=A0ABS0HAC1_9ACTN|nr:VOC family protein [Plantactinospora alkalitolerans]MBF9135424.1 VOC family protein [Plantactinospora alkalitolerans]